MILYEFPFNERVRTLLRLEDQFERLFFFAQQEEAHAHHAALSVLFDIADALNRASGRTDVRTELLQELERQRQALTALREHPAIELGTLDATIDRLQAVCQALTAQANRPGDMLLRQNEWLAALRGRLVIPGGLCEFDMPSYHAWQHRGAAARLEDLRTWCTPMLPIYEGLALALRLMRENGRHDSRVAQRGSYQQMPNGKVYQLMRVGLPDGSRVFPEISANKYSISIRFAQHDHSAQKPQSVDYDVPFTLTLCQAI